MVRFCALLLSCAAFSTACRAASAGTLSVSQNEAGEVIAAVSALVPRCGITAGGAPSYQVSGYQVDVRQPLIGITCLTGIPPGAQTDYNASLNFGRLPGGTYTISWSFPALSASYTVSGTPPEIGPGFTGSWYNPDQSGHGFQIEILDTPAPQALVTWYVFAPDGGQAWISGTGPISGNQIVVQAERVTGAGALFPPRFDPARVDRQPWGTLMLTFSDCNHGRVAWHSVLPDYGDGELPVSRLTLPAGLRCP